jgi:hypothetical protein
MLLILGGAPATQPYVKASQIFSVAYFAYFLIVLPMLPFIETHLLKYFTFRKPIRRFTRRQKKKVYPLLAILKRIHKAKLADIKKVYCFNK